MLWMPEARLSKCVDSATNATSIIKLTRVHKCGSLLTALASVPSALRRLARLLKDRYTSDDNGRSAKPVRRQKHGDAHDTIGTAEAGVKLSAWHAAKYSGCGWCNRSSSSVPVLTNTSGPRASGGVQHPGWAGVETPPKIRPT